MAIPGPATRSGSHNANNPHKRRIGENVMSNSKNIESITYQGTVYTVKCIDGYVMVIDSEKAKGDFTIYKCRYFGRFNECIVAKRGDYYAHGDTLKEAVEDVNFKFLQETFDLDTLVSEIKSKKTMSVSEYRLITGACRQGCANFRKSKGIESTELPLKEVINITKNEYGGDRVQELFD